MLDTPVSKLPFEQTCYRIGSEFGGYACEENFAFVSSIVVVSASSFLLVFVERGIPFWTNSFLSFGRFLLRVVGTIPS